MNSYLHPNGVSYQISLGISCKRGICSCKHQGTTKPLSFLLFRGQRWFFKKEKALKVSFISSLILARNCKVPSLYLPFIILLCEYSKQKEKTIVLIHCCPLAALLQCILFQCRNTYSVILLSVTITKGLLIPCRSQRKRNLCCPDVVCVRV